MGPSVRKREGVSLGLEKRASQDGQIPQPGREPQTCGHVPCPWS